MTASATAEAAAPAEFLTIPLSSLIENGHNYRKTHNEEEDLRLAESIRSKGVLQPLLVRPIEGKRGRYEVVFGNRRFAAARVVGLTSVPCHVRELTDCEALEAALIENVQRVDVHPMEEAEGFAELTEKHGYTVTKLAEKTGRSENWIRGRLKLAEVHKSGRKACLDGTLSAGVVMLAARLVPKELQEEAFGSLCDEAHYTGRSSTPHLSIEDAREILLREFARRLENAPWKLDDEELEPVAGACSKCPKRSKNEPALFAELDKADVCLDGSCWARKLTEQRKQVIARAEKSGTKVLEGKAAKKAMSSLVAADHREWTGNGYVDASKLAQKAGAEPVLAIDERGEVHELYEPSDVKKGLPKRERQVSSSTSRALDAAAEAALVKLAEVGGGAKAPEAARVEFYRMLVGQFWSDVRKRVASRRGLEKGKGYRDPVEAFASKANLGDLESLVWELTIQYGGEAYGDGMASAKRLLTALGVNFNALKKQAAAELAPKPAAAKKPAKAIKAKKGAPKK